MLLDPVPFHSFISLLSLLHYLLTLSTSSFLLFFIITSLHSLLHTSLLSLKFLCSSSFIILLSLLHFFTLSLLFLTLILLSFLICSLSLLHFFTLFSTSCPYISFLRRQHFPFLTSYDFMLFFSYPSPPPSSSSLSLFVLFLCTIFFTSMTVKESHRTKNCTIVSHSSLSSSHSISSFHPYTSPLCHPLVSSPLVSLYLLLSPFLLSLLSPLASFSLLLSLLSPAVPLVSCYLILSPLISSPLHIHCPFFFKFLSYLSLDEDIVW